MVKRKQVASQSATMPPYPTSPLAPPPPPPMAPPPPIPNSNDNNHVLDATDEWDNQDDDNGSDWWDHSDDEDDKTNQARAKASSGQNNPQNQDLLDFLPTLKPQEKDQRPGSNQDIGDLGVSALSISASPSASRPLDPNHNNPFLRRPSNPSPEPESTATIWQENHSVPHEGAPQLPLPNFSREPLSPKLFDEWADRHIAQSAGSHQPIHAIESENPWEGAGSENKKLMGSLGRKPVPNRSVSSTVTDERANGQASPSSKNVDVATPPLKEVRKHQIQIPQGTVSPPDVDTPQTTAKKQRSESYQIKHIRWHDARSRENPRSSPILTQNLNGPCPLLALVNALVLSTPATLITPLVDTLRTREQVSLGLLLDAVFDELMSDRRGGGAHQLPDVGDLYSFLVTLHTGMNVNPRFVPQDSAGPRGSAPGIFEDTMGMRLYSTFAIPLIHGWLPDQHDEAFGAFQRLAPTYEDAQNMQFREKDLEQKLQSERLSDEEETLYIDLTSIREFLTLWPTQLTHHGLRNMKESLEPGQFAILFRNDHFSTLYKEPRSKQLMTLVTDAGYATHDEIVWESLVDINGSQSELFAGDFKSVSHHGIPDEIYQDQAGWTTVDSKASRGRRPAGKSPAVQDSSKIATLSVPSHDSAAISAQAVRSSSPSPSSRPPRARTASEQEDHDLALALQLQEEEEQALRRQARQEENEATQRYLNQESSRRGPEIPPRRSNVSSTNTNPPLPGPRPIVAAGATTTRVSNPEDGEDAPPPPYEQATAKGTRPYVPPPTHPSSEHAPLRSPGASSTASNQQRPTSNQQRPASLYSQNSQTYYGNQPSPGQLGGRRRLSSRGGPPSPYHAARGRGGMPVNRSASATGPVRTAEEEEKCNIM